MEIVCSKCQNSFILQLKIISPYNIIIRYVIHVDPVNKNETIRLKDRKNKLETVFNPRFNIIENSMNELLKTILNKL